jgi:hypothetical protein
MSRFSLTRALYSAARAARWAEVLGKAAQGESRPLEHRLANKAIFRAISPIIRK